jgi:hypothetical protein
MLKILVINRSSSISDQKLDRVCRAVDRQLREDVYPAWSIRASIRLSKRRVDLEQKRDGAVIFIDDKPDPEYAGYHEFIENTALPVGFVFRDVAEEIEDWSVTLSHEAIELVGNRHCGLHVPGPHPKQKGRIVQHWFELCDAVQDTVYSIDRVSVSNFLYPLYFTAKNEEKGINDHLKSRSLTSFGILPGGYVGFRDEKGVDRTVFSDKRAERRHRAKDALGELRRLNRMNKNSGRIRRAV